MNGFLAGYDLGFERVDPSVPLFEFGLESGVPALMPDNLTLVSFELMTRSGQILVDRSALSVCVR